MDFHDKNVKEEIFKELKDTMRKFPESITQSSKNATRFIVTAKSGLHFVLQEISQGKKKIYVPITVLDPTMGF